MSVNTKAKVKVLLVTLDFKESLETKVVPFLNNNKYSTECVLLDEVDGNVFINKINPKWSGAIPATYFTKGNKKQEEFIEKKLTYETLEATLGKF